MRYLLLLLLSLPFAGYADVGILDSLEEPQGTELNTKRTALERRRTRLAEQSSSEARQRADELYFQLGYMSSTDFYQQLDAADMSSDVLRHLANSYRLNSHFREAEYWYSQYITEASEPEDYLRYAQMLQINNKCEEATDFYLQYYSRSADNYRYILDDCEALETIPQLTDIKITNLEEINGPLLDFSPVRVGDRLYFTSNRGTHRFKVNRDKWTKTEFTDLFVAKVDAAHTIKNVHPIQGELNDKYHDGVPTFDRTGTRMIFTHSNRKDKRESTTRDLKLYSSQLVNDKFWSDPIELTELNDDTYASAHPTLTQDGQTLYFSSDRPGGYGGMDLYVTTRTGNSWTTPRNLGPEVNTSGKEVFPWVDTDGTLYFSSDGHLGLGSLDIYVTQLANGNWTPAQNLGAPFNGTHDDFGFVRHEQAGGGYFTSNREGGHGADDIYRWEGDLSRGNSAQRRKICLTDAGTGQPLADMTVTVIETKVGTAATGSLTDDNLLLTLKPLDPGSREYVLSVVERDGREFSEEQTLKTDKRGYAKLTVRGGYTYTLIAQPKGYVPLRLTESAEAITARKAECYPLERRGCLTLNGTVLQKGYPLPIPEATVYLRTHCDDQVTVVTADEAGRFSLCVPCDCEYYITGHKDMYIDGSTYLAAKEVNCAKVKGGLAVQLELTPPNGLAYGQPQPQPRMPAGYGNVYPGPAPRPGYPNGGAPYATPRWNPQAGYPASPNDPADLNRYFLGRPDADYRPGQLIRLTNLYYDFDEHYIRKDASRELDYVFALLDRYPTLEIALESHTDSRGSNRYNARLSQRRAEAATAYLTKRGIAPYRISFRGFGEALNVNECADGTECSEAAHQLNRRTEIRVTRFDEPGVQVGGR